MPSKSKLSQPERLSAHTEIRLSVRGSLRIRPEAGLPPSSGSQLWERGNSDAQGAGDTHTYRKRVNMISRGRGKKEHADSARGFI